MSLDSQLTRVSQGTKDTLKAIINKLGGNVGDEMIDQYPDLANALANIGDLSSGAIPSSEKGVAAGVATLGEDGKVPSEQLPDMDYANSPHASQHARDGIDPILPEDIGAVPAELVHLTTYTTLEQIGITVGSETMEAIALALPNNAVLEVSCSARNNSATDGTAFPVSAGGSSRYGILRVARISGPDRVSFEFRAKEPASRMYVGFWSTDGGWTGWEKVYTEGSKPTAAELGAAPASHTQAASTITTGTFASTATYAKTGTDYTTYRIRNIAANTTAMTAGSTALSNGNIYLQYE